MHLRCITMSILCCYCVGGIAGFANNAAITRAVATSSSKMEARRVENVAIIGGGLAGLSAAFHLVDIAEKKRPAEQLQITIFDKAQVGLSGASAVAGGLMHPFSPRGKLIHFGQSALEQSKVLVEAAAKHRPACVLRDHLYRVALSDKNVDQLKDTASKYPELATWMSKEDLHNHVGIDCLGGLKLSNGCQVIHVPTYLEGLLEEIKMKAKDLTNGSSVKWEVIKPNDHQELNQKLKSFDSVILSAGSGLLHNHFIESDSLPVQLVRGQSIEIGLSTKEKKSFIENDAVLCGKYISPLPFSTQDTDPQASTMQRYVIGATHEFKNTPLTAPEVIEELRSRTYQFAPHLWDEGVIDKITHGVRMQSNRGAFGRMPIIGQCRPEAAGTELNHEHMWLFTGLSSRGLIYHAIFGKWLANGVLHDNENLLENEFEQFDWWRRK
eukprot:scaffold3197_cov153-Skeletonema_menzelii.AAC.18